MPVFSQAELDELRRAHFDRRMRELLQPLVSPHVIEEHRANPIGQHSDGLRRLLTYLAGFPGAETLVIEHDGAERWFVSRKVDSPSPRVDRIDGPFGTVGAAATAVFLIRLAEVFDTKPEA
jgi:branched-chain amino acid transport system permease protein